MIDVLEMNTGRVLTYDTNNPERAVKLAFLQYGCDNFNTWNYEELFVSVSTHTGKLTISCGWYGAFLDGRSIS